MPYNYAMRYGRRLAGRYARRAIRYGIRKGASAIGSWARRRFGRKYRAVATAQTERRGFRPQRAKRFLRSIGMTQNKTVTLVFRGSKVMNYDASSAGTDPKGAFGADLKDICYWSMVDPRDPAKADINLGAAWRKTATGFTHMAALYSKFRVLSSKAVVNVKSGRTHFNDVQLDYVPMKFGLHKSESTSITNEGVASWDQVAMLDGSIKTYYPSVTAPSKGVTLVTTYHAGRWRGLPHVADAYIYNVGTKLTSPSTVCNACLWGQIQDKASVPIDEKYVVTWTITYRVNFSDFNGPESDMIQDEIPS